MNRLFQSQQDGPDTIGTTNFLQKIVSNISGSEVREDQGIYFPVHQFGKGVIVFQYLFIECQYSLEFAITNQVRIFLFNNFPGVSNEVGFR